jgi:hypothetical protein
MPERRPSVLRPAQGEHVAGDRPVAGRPRPAGLDAEPAQDWDGDVGMVLHDRTISLSGA